MATAKEWSPADFSILIDPRQRSAGIIIIRNRSLKSCPVNHCGISIISCNCTKENSYNDEFCVICNESLDISRVVQQLPLGVARVNREFGLVGLTWHSPRKSAAMFAHKALLSLRLGHPQPVTTIKNIEARLRYTFVWSNGSRLFSAYHENSGAYAMEDLVPSVSILRFIFSLDASFPIARLWPCARVCLSYAQLVQIRNRVFAEAAVSGCLRIQRNIPATRYDFPLSSRDEGTSFGIIPVMQEYAVPIFSIDEMICRANRLPFGNTVQAIDSLGDDPRGEADELLLEGPRNPNTWFQAMHEEYGGQQRHDRGNMAINNTMRQEEILDAYPGVFSEYLADPEPYEWEGYRE